MERNTIWHRAISITGICFGLMLPGISYAADSNIGTGINKGLLGQLSGNWWQWSLSIPQSVHPLTFNDTPQSAQSALYCGVGQHGNAWFLGGTLDGSAAQRSCKIPAGIPIFAPIINAECSTVEGNGSTEEELRACAKSLIDHVTVVEASVDGAPLKDLQKSRVQSKLFSFTLPPDDILGLFGHVPNPSPSVSDGFWVLLQPLPEGVHTLVLHGVAPFPEFGFTFEQNTTCSLTVVSKQP